MNPDILKILQGPHKYVNGQYISALPTQDEINEAENKRVAEEKAKAEAKKGK